MEVAKVDDFHTTPKFPRSVIFDDVSQAIAKVCCWLASGVRGRQLPVYCEIAHCRLGTVVASLTAHNFGCDGKTT